MSSRSIDISTSIEVSKTTKYNLNNGKKIPVIGYGCYLVSENSTANSVYEALKAGYRHIDSAAYYQNEREAAQGIAKFLKEEPSVSRSDIWYTTKILQHGYEESKKAVTECGNKVKDLIDYIDLVLIHSPTANKEERVETWKIFQEIVSDARVAGVKVGSIGVSNYGIRHLEEIYNMEGFSVAPVVNQVELHPWLPRNELRDYCAKKGILMEAYSPLTQGQKLNDPKLLEISKDTGLSPAEILLKWSFIQGFIVLVKSEKVSRIKSNFDILPDSGKIELDKKTVEQLHMPESNEVITWNHIDLLYYP